MSANKAGMKDASKRAGILAELSAFLPLAGLILVTLVFGITSKGLLFSPYNLRSLITQTTPILIMACGAMFIYSLGNMDVSMGTEVGVCGLCSVLVVNATGSLELAIAVSIIMAVAFSSVNSVLSGILKIPPILASVCTMMIGRGVLTIITTKAGGSGIRAVHNLAFLKAMPTKIAAMIIVALVLGYLFRYTSLGKSARSVGANPACAVENGIQPFKTQMLCYMVLGLTVGIAAAFIWANTRTITRASGMGYEMDVMIALILGGMSLNGGMRSRFTSAIIGSFTYIILQNGLLLSSFLQYNQVDLAKAIIFIVMIVITCREKGNLLPK